MTGSDAQMNRIQMLGDITRGCDVRPIYGTSRMASVGHVTQQ